MVNFKTEAEIDILRENALMACDTLAYLASLLKPGITGNFIDKKAEEFIRDQGAVPGFLGYRGFEGSLCISVNEYIVHGIPSDEEIKEGDVVSLDCGILKNGYYGDVGFSFAMAPMDKEVEKLLTVTRECLDLGVAQAIAGGRTGDIGFAIQQYAEKEFGYGIVRELVGHGLGKDLHEKPDVPNYGRRGSGIRLKAGMVIAIEPMINLGTRRIRQKADGWGIVTKDGAPSAHYEHDLVVREIKPEVLSDHDRIDVAIKANDLLHFIPTKLESLETVSQ